MRILLLEDTEDVADAIKTSFQRRGDAIDHASSLAEAQDNIAVQAYDVAILDIGLPDGSGLAFLKSVRQSGLNLPVLMLTARSEVDDRVIALDTGADDYLVKPFDLRELHARVRAMLRRKHPDHAGVISFGDILFDAAGRTVTVNKRSVLLTRREFSLLEILLASRNRVVSKDRLFEGIFSFDEDTVGVNAVELYVGRLRKKLADSSVTIKTLRGLGYQMVNND